jgi:hypothetical protein
MATKKEFFGYGTFLIKDGSKVRFWEDKWLGATSLREQYPILYAIVRHKGDTIAHVLEYNPPNVTFRRNLLGPRLVSWEALLQRLADVQLTNGKDEFRWNLHENGKFSIAFMYNAMIMSDLPVLDNNKIYKLKIPFKNNFLHGIYVGGLFLLKIILLNEIDMGVRHVFFVLKMR